ncbi:phosphodiesterase [Streptomyces viridifaciens]|uniref:phosphodiesterase n=1 Tax=Kitasatospora aureofaciens TaxID=1894 RepID=UPI00092AF59D|nr:phosphodiesterase [Streptomyces viridifaciens]UKZ04374.1 phosphodiesterase [Streptomyces viridifaciens]
MSPSPSDDADRPTVLAHLSDLHLDDGPRAEERVRRMVRYLVELPGEIDAVLITGDIADRGTEEAYVRTRAVLAPLYERFPVLVCPGNHDEARALRRILLDGGGEGEGTGDGAPVDQVRDVAGTRIVLCDSSVPGRADGLLRPQTLRWLDETLAEAPDRPTLVALHHPPAELGLPYIDGIRLREADRFAAVLRGHPQVAGVLCGHAHTMAVTRFADLPLVCAPGVASSALMPWEQEPGQLWKTLDAPPALAFHVLRNGRLTSHARTVLGDVRTRPAPS